MTHRTAEPLPQPVSWRSRVFSSNALPHWAMVAVTLFYIGNLVAFGAAGVPQTISLAWAGTLATWFGYCIRERAVNKGG